MRQYFEHERLKGHRINLQKVVERTAAATGASHNIVARIKTEEDVENWLFNSEEPLKTLKKSEVPEKYSALVRYVIRDVYLAKTVVPSVDRILDKISAVKVQDVQHLNLFDESELYEDDAVIWRWGRTALYRFMKDNGFVYGNRITLLRFNYPFLYFLLFSFLNPFLIVSFNSSLLVSFLYDFYCICKQFIIGIPLLTL